jgi:hypothetical protein
VLLTCVFVCFHHHHQVLDLRREAMYTCIAVSGNAPAPSDQEAAAPDNHGHTMPSLMRR